MRKALLASGSITMALAGVAILFAAPAANAKPKLNPIIFVHGASGSGAQFESQGMRFTSNGYPLTYIRALEYDSSSIGTILPLVHLELDALIAELQAFSGQAQVDLLGHSLGTFVSQTYLASPARAANVAHYVNIDGGSAPAPPGGVPTLALWAGDAPPIGSIVGAINVTLAGQEHVESASSPEAFFEMYSFFRGGAPATTDIVPEPPGQVSIKGRVDAFPQNAGLAGATLEIWEVDRATGERKKASPLKTFLIDATGDFGPVDEVKGGKYYEFAVIRAGFNTVNYFYEPFLRSDHLVRLNVGDGLAPFIDSSANHTSVTVLRNKELCADKGALSDELSIGGTQVLNLITAPCASVGGSAVAMFAFDNNSDGVTDLATVPFPFPFLAFLGAVDLFIPTAPLGTVSVVTVPRGDFGATRTVNVPNLSSLTNRVVIQLNDFEQ